MGIFSWWTGPLLAVGLLFGEPAAAQELDLSWPKCKEHKGDPGIAACTAQIQSGGLSAPILAMAYYYRGFAYGEKHQTDQAIADYSEAIRLNPSLAAAYNNRGNIFSDISDFPRTLADYAEAVRLNPVFSKVFNNRCNVYLRTGNAEQALADCSEAIRLEPDYVHPYMGRALSYLAKGDADRTMADEDAVVHFDPADALASMNRGAARYIFGRYSEAAADLSESAKMGPTSAYPLLWLHLTLARSGINDHDILLRKAEKISRSGWPGPLLGFYLGELSAEQARAAAAQGEAKTQSDRDCSAAFFIGDELLLRNDFAAAKPLLQQAAKNCTLIQYQHAGAVAELRRAGN